MLTPTQALSFPPRLSTIVPLDGGVHDRNGFSCGDPGLDLYLQRFAGQNAAMRLSACYVLETGASSASGRMGVAGYYTLSSTSLVAKLTPPNLTLKAKYPEYPAALLGRLAVAVPFQRCGYAALLLADAIARIELSGMGVAFLLVDALPSAVGFYQKQGFVALPGSGAGGGVDRMVLKL